MKVLVLGGYGNFGARICRALAGDPGIQLLIGGRDTARAAALAATLPGSRALVVDHRATDFVATLAAAQVDLLIHTAGPFQGQDYAVAHAAARAAAHYIDLADGRRFVCDFANALDTSFRAAQRVAITGASTLPGLSSAVIDSLCAGWQAIHVIDTCIAPAQSAPRGLATLEAVLSYCGRPIQHWQDGRWIATLGWSHPARVEFHRMKPRLGAVCDVPDLELYPQHYRVRDTVLFRAALELQLGQRAFALLAALRRVRLLRAPEKFAGIVLRASAPLDRFGSALGGMFVRVRGVNAQGRRAARSWHIAADDDHGPEIPCMPAILLARALARAHGGAAAEAKILRPGARPCVGLLTLDDFAAEFERWEMVTDFVAD